MAKKISQGELERVKGEDGARVFTKTRARPVAVESTKPAELVRPVEKIDVAPVTEAINEGNARVVEAIQAIKLPEPKPAPQAMPETRPLIKNIHVKNIERNGQNRIESADFSFTYQESH